MKRTLSLLISSLCLTIFLLAMSASEAQAQYSYYSQQYYPSTNAGWSYQPQQRYYRSYAPTRTTRSRSSARAVTGVGSNLHRSFMIRQEQQRSSRTGQPPRNRGNILWAR